MVKFWQIHLSYSIHGSCRPICLSEETMLIGRDKAYVDTFRPVQVMCELVTRSEDEIRQGAVWKLRSSVLRAISEA